jgi:hypothetical protein
LPPSPPVGTVDGLAAGGMPMGTDAWRRASHRGPRRVCGSPPRQAGAPVGGGCACPAPGDRLPVGEPQPAGLIRFCRGAGFAGNQLDPGVWPKRHATWAANDQTGTPTGLRRACPISRANDWPAGETAAGSVQDDVRRGGHQMGGSSPMRDEEGSAFNAPPISATADQPNAEQARPRKARLFATLRKARGRNHSRHDLRNPPT